jgi:hypothetical protein
VDDVVDDASLRGRADEEEKTTNEEKQAGHAFRLR